MKPPICSSIAKTLALGITASVMFVAKPAEAAIFNVGGTDYDITTVEGSYDALSTQIQATPWWNSNDLSRQFAGVVGASLGLPNVGFRVSTGPLFAYDLLNSNVRSSAYVLTPDGGDSVTSTQRGTGISYVFAVGSAVPAAVPEPFTILGSITAVGFGVAFKRKKNSIKK